MVFCTSQLNLKSSIVRKGLVKGFIEIIKHIKCKKIYATVVSHKGSCTLASETPDAHRYATRQLGRPLLKLRRARSNVNNYGINNEASHLTCVRYVIGSIGPQMSN